jgi:hypothetical protein
VDPIACPWEARTDSPAKKAEQPKNEQNYDDCPQHGISPFINNDEIIGLINPMIFGLAVQKNENSSRNGEDRQYN